MTAENQQEVSWAKQEVLLPNQGTNKQEVQQPRSNFFLMFMTQKLFVPVRANVLNNHR